MRKPLLGALALAAMSLAACGGGGGTTASVTPSGAGAGAGAVANAKASIVIQVPKLAASNIGTANLNTSTANGRKSPQYLSPGSDALTFVIDGTPVLTDAPVANYNNAGPHGNGTFDLPNGQTVQIAFASVPSDAFFTVTAAFTLTPGNHTVGVVDLSHLPKYVLSEGQRTYAFLPGTNDFSTQPLTLAGVFATGYIECATAAQNADTTGTCLNYANWNGSSYTFTAVAADFDGFPIVNQGSTQFDNAGGGGFTVFENPSDNPSGVVTVSNAGLWNWPGADITGPSGGWVENVGIPGPFAYGHHFSVKCNTTGTANLMLSHGPSTVTPIDGSPDAGLYPPNALTAGPLPLGTIGSSSTPRITNVAVNCTSTGTIIIQ